MIQHKKLKLSAGLLFVLGLTGILAQESVNTSGGDTSGSGGSVSYSVGEVLYQTTSGTNGSVAEGVQLPYEISAVTAIEEAKGTGLSVSAYPNPATDHLTLEIHALNTDNLSYQLYDIQGKLLQNEKINRNQVNISMGHLIPATYFVSVTHGSQRVKLFKIIKK